MQSVNGLVDFNHEAFQDTLNKYRMLEMRSSVDAIITSAARVKDEDSDFKFDSIEAGKPRLVVVDKDASTPPNSKIFAKCGKVTLVVSKNAPQGRIDRLRDNCDIEVLRYGELAVSLKEIMDDLGNRKVEKVLVEADGKLNTRLLNNNLVDEVYLLTLPVFLKDGHRCFYKKLKEEVRLQVDGIIQYGDQIVTHYLVRGHRHPQDKPTSL